MAATGWSARKRKRALLTAAARRKSKRQRIGDFPEEELKVKQFREWCHKVSISLHPNLYIGRHGSHHGLGVVAMETIKPGDVIARIPRSAILSSATGTICTLMRNDPILLSSLHRASSWIPLLITLVGEYSLKGSSRWQPYLDLVPNNSDDPPPMLWDEAERERLLRGTGIDVLVERDLRNLTHDYETIVQPFLKRHPKYFDESFYSSQQRYNEAVSFVMTYSFTDVGDDPLTQTMMVPFVDLLNHHSQNDVELVFHKKYLELVAINTIQRGKEIMNTFGLLSNHSLLHIHGFVEVNNPFDKACVPAGYLKDVYITSNDDRWKLERWQYLIDNDLLDDVFEVDDRGRPERHLLKIIKFLADETISDWSQVNRVKVKLSNLDAKSICLLRKFINECMDHLNKDVTSRCERNVSLLYVTYNKFLNFLSDNLTYINEVTLR